ncbi:MAG: hypothetical protein ACYTG0_18060 [Planctomycetota bacterium]
MQGFDFPERGDWQELLVVGDHLVTCTVDRLLGLDRHSGRILWRRETPEGLRINSLAAGGGKVYCLEGRSATESEAQKRRGGRRAQRSQLVAVDIRAGEETWRQSTGLSQSALAYSEVHDIVLLGTAAYRGADGASLRGGRPLEIPNVLHGDTIYTQHKKGYNDGRNARALELLTGERKMAPHPIKDTDILWYFARSHGCGDIVGSQHLLLFRSSTAAYYDLALDGGVTQLVGFRSSCIENMIAADGVLSAPNLSGCACNYPLFTPLALIHDAEAEAWSHYKTSNEPDVNKAYRKVPGRVKRAGLNFGAPGDRRTEDGTLWLDYPSVGGWSYDLPVKTDPANPQWFRYHASRVIEGKGLKWVQASGARDLRSVTIDLGGDGPRTYTVRIHYAEPMSDARGNLRGLVEERNGVVANRQLTWAFDAAKLVCGIELVEQDSFR